MVVIKAAHLLLYNKKFILEVHIHEENQSYLEEQEGEEGC